MTAPHGEAVTAADILTYTRQRLAASHHLHMLGMHAASQDVAEELHVDLVHRRPAQLAAMLDLLRHKLPLGYQLDLIGEHLTTVASKALPLLPRPMLAGAIVALLDQQARRDARRLIGQADPLAAMLAAPPVDYCDNPTLHAELDAGAAQERRLPPQGPARCCRFCGRPVDLARPYDQERQ